MVRFLANGQKMINREAGASAITYYQNCPECGDPSLTARPRPADENIGPGPIFASCQNENCRWAETLAEYQERTGEELW